MVSEQMVSFRNTFQAMVQAMFSVKFNAGSEAIYKFTYVPHLHFYVTSRGINMEGTCKYVRGCNQHLCTKKLYANFKKVAQPWLQLFLIGHFINTWSHVEM